MDQSHGCNSMRVYGGLTIFYITRKPNAWEENTELIIITKIMRKEINYVRIKLNTYPYKKVKLAPMK